MRLRSLAWLSTGFLVLALSACGVSGGTGRPPRDGGGVGGDGFNPGSDGFRPAGDMSTQGPCASSSDCPTGYRCLNQVCIVDNGTCTSDDQCENDTYCECSGGGGGDMGACLGGVCVQYGTGPRGTFNPDCHSSAFSATDFKPPVVHCQWQASSNNWVVMTPVVADLDGDGAPEIVFGPMWSPDGFTYSQRLVAIHSSDCSVVFDVTPQATLEPFSQIAVADLDGDKVPEIVALAGMGSSFSGPGPVTVEVFDNKGNLLASSPTSYTLTSSTGWDCSGPAIANIDGMGAPEIAVAGQVLRYSKGQGSLQLVWSKQVTGAFWGTLDTIADLDGDGVAEVLAGTQIFDGATGNDKTPSPYAQAHSISGVSTGSYTGIADFNKDGKPDIVAVVSSQTDASVFVYDFANQRMLMGPYSLPRSSTAGSGYANGGPPNIADFDGDGVPDFGFAGADRYRVYALKCAQTNKPADCQGPDPGVLWMKSTQDFTSGGTASSVFDFNGDGKAEVVYRDECWLRVYNGPDGKTVFAASVTSGTALELPVIADIDNDGHADIVVSSDNEGQQFGGNCSGSPEADTGTAWTGYTSGVATYRDPMNRWMPSRSIWNEHSYHITNVNDDTTIPMSEMPNWKSWNNYRQNVQGMQMGTAMPQNDYTGGVATMLDNGGADCMTSERLWANLCNRGTATASAGVAGTFYTSDPRQTGATAICTAMTTMSLAPGQCEAVYCDWKNPPQGPQNLWFRADDNGSGTQTGPECLNDNDLLYLPNTTCYVPG